MISILFANDNNNKKRKSQWVYSRIQKKQEGVNSINQRISSYSDAWCSKLPALERDHSQRYQDSQLPDLSKPSTRYNSQIKYFYIESILIFTFFL